MNTTSVRTAFGMLVICALTACSGAGSDGAGGSGLVSVPTVPIDPPDEVADGAYADVSDRMAVGTAGMIYVVLEDQIARQNDGVTITYNSGAIAGGLIDGTDLDNAEYTNPANGEFSRIVRITGDNVFGAVGLDVMPADLPTAGTVTSYNEGWVGMTAALENNTYVLEGDAIFTATWGSSELDGQFVNLSGTRSNGGAVTNVGNINLSNAAIAGDTFSGGSVTGTGIFTGLGGGSSTVGTSGAFFGPEADEIGGVISIDDSGADIRVLGAFQAD